MLLQDGEEQLVTFIFRQSAVSRELERRYNKGDTNSWLLGYPQKPYLMTPIIDAHPGTPEGNYKNRLIRARNSVERCNGVLKAVFRCLSGKISCGIIQT